MKIKVFLDEALFRRFTKFDILSRRRLWRLPVTFAAILTAAAAVAFIMHRVEGAVFLGVVLLIVGLGMPLVYFSTFFLSLKKQVKLNRLSAPRLVYTLTLTEDEEGIAVENLSEHAVYRWKQVYHVYRDGEATYLYMTPDRAFILPDSAAEGSPEELWTLICRMVEPEKCTVLKQ